jgi:hypothetical protein
MGISVAMDNMVRLQANDTLGQQRETYFHPQPDCYISAFKNIEKGQ